MSEALRIHRAFENGELEALRSAAGDPPGFPNCEAPLMAAHCLGYAIYHSPLPFIRTLVDLGADPNYEDDGGYPSILAALSTDRPDKYRIVELLLAAGADVDQRGVNDYTPLHYAASRDDVSAIELLVSHGADLAARTRVDDFATPLEEAELLGRDQAVEALKRAARRQRQ